MNIAKKHDNVSKMKIAVTPGYVVLVELTATGGVKRRRKNVEETEEFDDSPGSGVSKAKIEYDQVTDSRETVAGSKSHLQKTYYDLRHLAPRVPVGGYFVDSEDRLKDVEDYINNIVKSKFQKFNAVAEREGSKRRLGCDYYVFKMDKDNENIRKRLVKHIRDTLHLTKEALLEGDIKKIEAGQDAAHLLETVLASKAHKDALGSFFNIVSPKQRGDNGLKEELLKMIRDGEDPSFAGKKLEKARITKLDEIIDMFTEED